MPPYVVYRVDIVSFPDSHRGKGICRGMYKGIALECCEALNTNAMICIGVIVSEAMSALCINYSVETQE